MAENEFVKIERSVDAGIRLLSKTLDFYTNVKSNKKLNPEDVRNLLQEIGANKDELSWVLKQIQRVQKNPLDLNIVRIKSEKNSTEMAIRLLEAISKTSPGRGYPPANDMVKTLGIQNQENVDEFKKGYEDAVEKLNESHLSAAQKSFNMWYYICMSMFGAMALAVVLLILRKAYEKIMEYRERVAKFVLPNKKQLAKFSLWNFISRKNKPKGPRVIVLPDPDESDNE
jgi:hypothetical protein